MNEGRDGETDCNKDKTLDGRITDVEDVVTEDVGRDHPNQVALQEA
ncbi:DUF4025 domain-containing protein [Caenorhabditis elegans]|uniref:DUF4025 domain-containing protein n=1 Tax=Caenorhabditis elegans TaxID=6239 RepID=G1K0Y3_CAEEL|nr:DUF4025 domain-containing protein [Caenorhabditis elegans]CCC42202.1 DUF4025 domain-containing protein [Caenorhabditis elegans]|eukprot:NP_001256683.1 Uncharacterized protein CELE_T26E4.18 [Caenorhabditis elegans]